MDVNLPSSVDSLADEIDAGAKLVERRSVVIVGGEPQICLRGDTMSSVIEFTPHVHVGGQATRRQPAPATGIDLPTHVELRGYQAIAQYRPAHGP